jgi:hypothetical protein
VLFGQRLEMLANLFAQVRIASTPAEHGRNARENLSQ